MNDFEEMLNNSLREKVEKYERELETIKSDYEKNLEKIKQELYQKFSEEQDVAIEVKKRKKNTILQKLRYWARPQKENF